MYLLRSLSASVIRPVPTRTKSFKGTFFPCINEWNKLKVGIRNAKSMSLKNLLQAKKKKKTYFVFMIHLV